MTVFEVECEVGGYYPDYIDWPDCEDPNPPNCTDFPAAPPGVPISIVEAVPQKPGGFVLYKCNDSSQASTLGDVIQVIIQNEVSFCIFTESKNQPVLNSCSSGFKVYYEQVRVPLQFFLKKLKLSNYFV